MHSPTPIDNTNQSPDSVCSTGSIPYIKCINCEAALLVTHVHLYTVIEYSHVNH